MEQISYEFEVPAKKKKVIKKEKLTLTIGQKIAFGFFKNITFEGFDENGYVIMKDKAGNIKKEPRWLFEKYVRIED